MSSINGGCFIDYNERFLSLLNVCRRAPSLAKTKALHALSITLSFFLHQPVFVCNNVISLYSSNEQISAAAKVFDDMPDRNTVSFNTMIAAYSKYKDAERAFDVFSEMRARGFSPTQFTISGLLSGDSMDMDTGTQLHGLSFKNGLFRQDAFVGTALLCLYGKLGLMEMAIRVFEEMEKKSMVTWNSMLSLLGQHGFLEESLYLLRELVRMNAPLSEYSLSAVLSSLTNEEDKYLAIGEQLHCLSIKVGLDLKVPFINSLITAYSICEEPSASEIVFEEAVSKDIISWNSIIRATSKTKNLLKSLNFFVRLLRDEICPNEITFASVVNACAGIKMSGFGHAVHGVVIKNGFEADVIVGSALIDFYVKSDNLEDSKRCFDGISEKNIVSWNSLISGYAHKGVSLYLQMLRFGFRPNEFTFSIVLRYCLAPELKQLHSTVIKTGHEDNAYVLSSLMASYVKNQLMNDALKAHRESPTSFTTVPSNIIAGLYNRSGQYLESMKLVLMQEHPDVVSWNIAMAACSRTGDQIEALELFRHMLRSNVSPNNYTYVSVLSVCSSHHDLTLGSSVHALLIKSNFNCADTFVCNVLIDMYGKCGSINSAVKVFEATRDKNLITWTAMISSLGIHGEFQKALDMFREMVSLGFKPDKVSFVSLLTVCRNGGLVREGMEIFSKMKSDYEVEPEMDHYRCLVDLLVRNGCMKEAEKLIGDMPFPPDALVWHTFLEGCKRFTE